VEVPLSFHRPVVVLDDCLPAFVEMFFFSDILSVDVDVVLMFGAFDDSASSTGVFGTPVQNRASFAVFGLEVLYPDGACAFSGRTAPVFFVPGSVGGQD